MERSFVNLDNARNEEQRQIMKVIEEKGFCPFCERNRAEAELKPIIKAFAAWEIRENRWPYENTRFHFIIIHRRHIERLQEITPDEWYEFGELLGWLERNYPSEGGAVGFRFGDSRISGGTVNHLHAHFIIPKITDRNDPDYKPVRFRMG